MATRLRRLKIERFRDLRPGTELFFNDGWNVLLGRNGSGKTTLLHLISMVLRDDFQEAQEEEFALEYELGSTTGGTVFFSIRHAVVPEKTDFPLGRVWDVYHSRLNASTQPRAGHLYSTATKLVITAVDGRQWRGSFFNGEPEFPVKKETDLLNLHPLFSPKLAVSYGIFLSEFDSADDSIRRPELELFSLAEYECFRVDEGLAMFDSICGVVSAPRPSVFRKSRLEFKVDDKGNPGAISANVMIPSSLAKLIMSSYNPSSPVFQIALEGNGLSRVLSLLEARRVSVVAKNADDHGKKESIEVGHFEFYAQFTESGLIHHSMWSFGQQRLLTLFWYLACNPEVLVVDEPVNGLHWEWIEAFVEAVGDRQVFVTAQNPLLLEHVGFDSPEKVERSFVLCRREARGEDEREMVWAQPTPEQAESFFRAWSTGVQPVHEVLKTEGLW